MLYLEFVKSNFLAANYINISDWQTVDLSKDAAVWLDGVRLMPISLIISWKTHNLKNAVFAKIYYFNRYSVSSFNFEIVLANLVSFVSGWICCKFQPLGGSTGSGYVLQLLLQKICKSDGHGSYRNKNCRIWIEFWENLTHIWLNLRIINFYLI